MRKQSLSRKIILAYSLLATLAAGLLTSNLYWQSHTVQRQEIRNRLLELLQLSAPQIDGDYLALTTTADSMKLPFYTINQKRLQNIQAAVPSIDHIYVLRQLPNGQSVFILDYAVDRPSTPVGKPVQRLTPMLKAGIANLKQPIVEPDLLNNPAGTPVLYGYAPIKNQFGRTNGVLVIALNASSIIQSEVQAGEIAASIFCIVLVLTLGVIWWLSQALVIHPILQLNQASQQIASGHWNQRLPIDRSDELGDLAASFNQMAKQLQESFATLEQRVRDRTYQLQLALSAAKMGTWEWDMLTNRQYWSAENYGLWGFSTDPSGRVLDRSGVEISPFPTFEVVLKRVHPDDRDRLLHTIQQTSRQDQPYEIEHRILWHDGSIRWRYSRGAYGFNEQGDPIKLVGISMDVTDRKQAEADVRRSKDLFEAMFEESADAIFLVDATTKLNLTCNQRAVELFEANSRDELIGIHGPSNLSKDPFTPEALAVVRISLATQGFWQGEDEYLTRKGNTFWGSIACKQIQVANEPMILVRVTDMSDRKRAELEIRHNRDLFEAIFQESTDAILLTAPTSGQIWDCNQRAIELFEAETKVELLGTVAHSLRKHPISEEHGAEILTFLRGSGVWRQECEYRTRKGHTFWGSVALKGIQVADQRMILARITDISDRKAAETALQISEQNFRTIFNHVTSYLFIHAADGTLLDVNDRVLERYGLEREQALSLSLLSDYSAADNPFQFAQGYWMRAFAGEIVHFEWKAKEIHTGKVFDVNVTLNRITWDHKPAILANVLDITERKQAELRQQQQAEADQLLATIAQTINQSVRLDQVLETCLEKIQQFLRSDRVLICRFDADYNVVIEREALSRPELSLLNLTIEDPCFGIGWAERYRQGYITVCGNAQDPHLTPCYATLLAQMQVQASFVVGILQSDQIWGLMIVHYCDAPHAWQQFELDLLKQLGLQVGTASQKASLYTQLEKQLKQKEVLLKEVNHRVKNNLQMISAMLWLQSEAANNPIVSGALFSTRNRLQAMSLIHEILYQSSDLGQINFHDYIQRLANNILIACSTSHDQIKLSFDLQPVTLNLETAISCGLLLNELITNAIKHGFPDRHQGEIHIRLEQIVQPEPTARLAAKIPTAALHSYASQATAHYMLTVQDNGVGIPKTLNLNKLQSLGLKIVYDLARQLDGTIEHEHKHGTLFRLLFPVFGLR
ncbi:MAG: PAS domain S-box protein [Lyngbya sp. HA4199-MV5]|jgi:hypothetical protein|nr:PAS domain S-box protein [Lyngbya sp. HA4199-MV5]